jgi:hypothetical protein
MRHATALLYHVREVASRNIRFASCGTSGKLTLWTRYVLVLEQLGRIASSHSGGYEGLHTVGYNAV